MLGSKHNKIIIIICKKSKKVRENKIKLIFNILMYQKEMSSCLPENKGVHIFVLKTLDIRGSERDIGIEGRGKWKKGCPGVFPTLIITGLHV